jgi:hypothetical protein
MKCLFYFALLGLGVLGLGCSSGPADASSQDVDETETTADELATSNSTYYVARRDLRRCMAPMCGGYFVSRVNRSTTRCADGSYAASCYVAELDLGQLGLSPSEEQALEGGIGIDESATKVVLRGYVGSKTFGGVGRFGVFRASEAWQARGDATISGTFYRVEDNGIRCITFPCPTLTESKLNSTTQRRMTGLNLASAPGAQSDKDDAIAATTIAGGLLAAGTNVTIANAGPAGSARELRASQYFLRVKHAASSACSADADCGAGELCCYPCGIPGCRNRCMAPDKSGKCPMFP